MAVDKYPLIAQLLRCPMDLTLKQQKVTLPLPTPPHQPLNLRPKLPVPSPSPEPPTNQEYMRTLFDSIDTDDGGSLDRNEWTQFFCPDRDAVPRALVYDPESAECQKVSGFIFDCDGTIYQL